MMVTTAIATPTTTTGNEERISSDPIERVSSDTSTVVSPTKEDRHNHNSSSIVSDDDDDDSSNLVLSGFDEIEHAFDRVSNAADALLDSIRDDSIRAENRKRESKRKLHADSYKSPTATTIPVLSDDDDDDRDHDRKAQTEGTGVGSSGRGRARKDPSLDAKTTNTNNKNNNSLDRYLTPSWGGTFENGGSGGVPPHHHDDHRHTPNFDAVDDDDDVSSLGDDCGESIDGSLVHDMKNLKSVSRAIQEELEKEGEAFQSSGAANNMKAYLQRLEAKAAADAKTPKAENLKTTRSILVHNSNHHATNHRNSSDHTGMSTISSRAGLFNNDGSSNSHYCNGNGDGGRRRTSHSQHSMMQYTSPSFLDQLHLFVTQLVGKNGNVPLLVANLAFWLLFCRLVYVSKHYLLDSEGRLTSPMSTGGGGGGDYYSSIIAAEDYHQE